ncbi:hypothetical protein ACLEJW_08715 [Pseudomonas sp. SMSB3]|uniref:hypothetical protein n=1 Tax=unclassified Pseudomonas TaxID=196821 RepID=UPI0011A3D92D|nr:MULTISPECIES: hypothetical protein [unclassified Pseudomonas]
MIEPGYPSDHAEKFPINREAPYSWHRAPSPIRYAAIEPTPATKDTQQILSFGELLFFESVFNEKEAGQAPTIAP